MKKALLNPLFLCALALSLPALLSCTSAKPANSRTSCPSDLFIEATGTGKTPSEASDKAKVEIGKKIISQVKSKTNIGESSKEVEGIYQDTSIYSALNEINSSSTLYGFKEMEAPKPLENGEYEIRGYVCNSDVARPYLKSLQNYRDSLKVLKRQKLDKDACGRAIEIREGMRGFEIILEVLEQSDKSLQKEYENIYAEIENDCGLEAGKKIHWNPEKETAYSKIAFSKLSKSVEIEASPCIGKGISLVYKGLEPKCVFQFGVNDCSYELSLSVRACNGTEYVLLKNEVTGAHQKKNFALEELQSNLKSAEFWNEWIQKIKQWSPQ